MIYTSLLRSILTLNHQIRGLQLTRTRGRNAHKKRANIRRKSEFAKVLALIFKHLAYFARFFSHTKCWHTTLPTLQNERKTTTKQYTRLHDERCTYSTSSPIVQSLPLRSLTAPTIQIKHRQYTLKRTHYHTRQRLYSTLRILLSAPLQHPWYPTQQHHYSTPYILLSSTIIAPLVSYPARLYSTPRILLDP